MGTKVAIIAGGGNLPRRLIAAARGAGREVLVIGFPGYTEAETLAAAPSMTVPLGALAPIFDRLQQEGITEIVMAGNLRRPSIKELRLDWRGARILAKVGLKALGDDGLLRAVIKTFEDEGIRIVAPDELLASLLAPEGCLTRLTPDAEAEEDIARGLAVVRAMGVADVGQAVVVQQGLVLGVEAIDGTDALIERTAALKREGPGGVLVKAKKPGQERRVDLPTIGPTTIDCAAAAGLRGVAVEAGGALILDRDLTVARADELGLFVVGVSPQP